MIVDQKSILYFIADCVPTTDELAKAKVLGTTKFRNVSACYDNDTIEICDGVAGCAPANYLARFPRMDSPVEKPAEVPPVEVPPSTSTPWKK